MAKTKRGRTRRSKGKGRIAGAGRRLAGHLGEQIVDVIGVGLVVLAVLTALGIWFGAAGPLGRGLTYVVRGAFGLVGFAFPVLALWWGVVLVRGTAQEERGRMLIGAWMTLLGGLGLWSLLAGNPSPVVGYEPLRDGGGLVGALVAWPLSRLVSVWGAGVVCVALTVLGILVYTATPMAAVIEAFRRPFEREDETEPRRRPPVPRAEPEPAVIGPAFQEEEEPE